MRILIVALLLTALAGCGKKDAEPTKSSGPVNTGAPSANAPATGANADAANALRAAQDKVAKPDPAVPQQNYTPVDRAPGDPWATYLAVAFDDQTLDDKQLLDLFSPRYFNEHDAFKQQAMAPTELPPIKERLAAYKKQRYYAVPFGLSDQNVMNPLIFFAGPYDFEKKSFPLNGSCGSYQVATRQNIRVKFAGPDTLCHLAVPDLDTAKQIEALRASNNATLRGTMYFFVSQVEDGNQLDAQLTGIAYEVWDKPAYLPGGKRVAVIDAK